MAILVDGSGGYTLVNEIPVKKQLCDLVDVIKEHSLEGTEDKWEPKAVLNWIHHTSCLIRLGKMATPTIDKLLEANPDNYSVLFMKAKSEIGIGHNKSALGLLSKAQTFVQEPLIFEYKGEVQEKLGNYNGAIETYESMKSIDSSLTPYVKIVRAHIKKGDYKSAMRAISTINKRKLNSDFDAYMGLERDIELILRVVETKDLTKRFAGVHKSPQTFLREYLKDIFKKELLSPQEAAEAAAKTEFLLGKKLYMNKEFLFNISRLYAKTGEHKSQETCLTKAIKLNKSHIEFWEILIYCRDKIGGYNAAMKTAEEAKKHCEYPEVIVGSQLHIATRNGKYKEADKFFREGLKGFDLTIKNKSMNSLYHGEYNRFMYNLACLRALQGHASAAKHWLTKAIEKNLEYLATAKTDPDFKEYVAKPWFIKLTKEKITS